MAKKTRKNLIKRLNILTPKHDVRIYNQDHFPALQDDFKDISSPKGLDLAGIF